MHVRLVQLMVFDSIEPPTSKTREMERLLTGLGDCKKFLFVDETEKVNDPLCRATGNLHYANVLPAKVEFLECFLLLVGFEGCEFRAPRQVKRLISRLQLFIVTSRFS